VVLQADGGVRVDKAVVNREGQDYNGRLGRLLRLYSATGLGRTLDTALNPLNFSAATTDVQIPWHLYVILSQLKGAASFSDSLGSKGQAVSDSGEHITLSYIDQLEQLGLWQWAIFVALHLSRENTRNGVITDLLARHIASIAPDTDEDTHLVSTLVDTWKIPHEWILETKVLHARSQGDHYLCAKNLILGHSPSEAQKTILMHIAPQAVISRHLTPLEDLLLLFDTHPGGRGWDVGGQLHLDYLGLVADLGGERRGMPSASQRDVVVRLVRGLPALETRTSEQKVERSEMARVVANLIASSSEFVCPLLFWNRYSPPIFHPCDIYSGSAGDLVCSNLNYFVRRLALVESRGFCGYGVAVVGRRCIAYYEEGWEWSI
jgi:nuclear pore complex protein Nup98-Nup96